MSVYRRYLENASVDVDETKLILFDFDAAFLSTIVFYKLTDFLLFYDQKKVWKFS